MKLTYFLFLAAPLLLAGCSTENVHEEAFNRDLVDGTITMGALHQLDEGNTNGFKRTETERLEMTVGGMAYYGDHAQVEPKVKDAEIALARQVLDYFWEHRKELDMRSPSFQGAMQGLRQILTDPADVQKLQTLSEYLSKVDQMRSVAPDVP